LNPPKHILLVTNHTVVIRMPRHTDIFNCYHIKCYAVQSGKQSPTFHKKTLFSSSALTADVVCLSEVLVVRNHPTRRHIPLHSNGHICHRQNFKTSKFLIVLNSIKLWNTKLKMLQNLKCCFWKIIAVQKFLQASLSCPSD
jgi:hypothetical protein